MESDVAFSRCESDELAVRWDLVAPEDVTSIRMALDMGLTLQRAPAEPPPSPPQEAEMPAGTVVSLGPVDDGGGSEEEGKDDEEQKESSEQPLDLEERPTGSVGSRGFLPLLNDFDAATHVSPSNKKKRPAKPSRSEQAQAQKTQARLQSLAEQQRALGVLDAALRNDPDGLSLHRLFPGFDGNLDTVPALVAQLFQSSHYPPIAYAVVGECQTRAAFLERLEINPALRTSVLFHGTRAPAVVPIATLGLRVPGECGVRAANGGFVGIYTALHPSTSMAYLDGARIMFVCLGLRDIEGRVPRVDPNEALMVQMPSVHLYFHSDLVIPVLAVKLSAVRSGFDRQPHPSPALCDIGPLAAVTEKPTK